MRMFLQDMRRLLQGMRKPLQGIGVFLQGVGVPPYAMRFFLWDIYMCLYRWGATYALRMQPCQGTRPLCAQSATTVDGHAGTRRATPAEDVHSKYLWVCDCQRHASYALGDRT